MHRNGCGHILPFRLCYFHSLFYAFWVRQTQIQLIAVKYFTKENTMKFKKVIAFVSAFVITGCSYNLVSVFSPENNYAITAQAAVKEEIVWKDGDYFYGSNMCPIKGYFKTSEDPDSAILILPSGEVYMRHFIPDQFCQPLTGKAKISEVKVYNDDTYKFSIDLSNFSKPSGVDDETWEAITNVASLNTERGLFFDKERKAFSVYCKYGWLLKKLGSPEYSTKGCYNMDKGWFETFNPGDVYQNNADYSSKHAPDLTDCTYLAMYLRKDIKDGDLIRNGFNIINADVDLDGKITQADLARLKQYIMHTATPGSDLASFIKG